MRTSFSHVSPGAHRVLADFSACASYQGAWSSHNFRRSQVFRRARFLDPPGAAYVFVCSLVWQRQACYAACSIYHAVNHFFSRSGHYTCNSFCSECGTACFPRHVGLPRMVPSHVAPRVFNERFHRTFFKYRFQLTFETNFFIGRFQRTFSTDSLRGLEQYPVRAGNPPRCKRGVVEEPQVSLARQGAQESLRIVFDSGLPRASH